MEKLKRGELRSDQYKQKLRKKKLTLLLLLLLLTLAVVGILILIVNSRTKSYSSFRLTKKAEWNLSIDNEYIQYRSGVLRFNRDGAEAVDQNGKVLWNVTYNMKDPIADVSGTYAVIADRGGTQLCIIDSSGTANRIEMNNNITDVDIAEQGVTAVLMNGGAHDFIKLYSMDSSGESGELVTGQTAVSLNGFPLDVAISKNGKKLTTSYIRLDGDTLTNGVTFYNLGDVGKNVSDSIVGDYTQENAIAPRVEFISENVVLVCRNDGFFLYTMDEVAKVRATVAIEEEIVQLAASSTSICAVLKNKSGNDRYQVILYDLNGKAIMKTTINDEFEKMSVAGGNIVLYSRLFCLILSSDGKEVFRGNFDKNIEYIYPTNEEDKYLVIGEGTMDMMQLTGIQN